MLTLRVPATAKAADGAETRVKPERLSEPWAAFLAGGWLLAWVLTFQAAPAPAADRGFHWLDIAVIGFLVSLTATMIMGACRHVRAGQAGIIAGGFALFGTVGCAAIGHVPTTSAAFLVPLAVFGLMTWGSALANHVHR